MRHFPIFVDLKCQRVVVSGAGETAAAKLRLLLKTEALIEVYGEDACDDVREWHAQGRLRWFAKRLPFAALFGARLVYAAHDEPEADERVRALGEKAGVLGQRGRQSGAVAVHYARDRGPRPCHRRDRHGGRGPGTGPADQGGRRGSPAHRTWPTRGHRARLSGSGGGVAGRARAPCILVTVFRHRRTCRAGRGWRDGSARRAGAADRRIFVGVRRSGKTDA